MGLMGSPWDGTSRYVRASNISLSWSDWEQYDVGTLKPWCGEITCSIIIIIIIIIIILLKCSKNTPICSDSKTMYQQPIPITHCLFPKKHTPPQEKKTKKTGDIISPTQTMHYNQGNPSKLPDICCLCDPPKNGSLPNWPSTPPRPSSPSSQAPPQRALRPNQSCRCQGFQYP